MFAFQTANVATSASMDAKLSGVNNRSGINRLTGINKDTKRRLLENKKYEYCSLLSASDASTAVDRWYWELKVLQTTAKADQHH